MGFQNRCPKCETALDIADKAAGKTVTCLRCQTRFTATAFVPEAEPPPDGPKQRTFATPQLREHPGYRALSRSPHYGFARLVAWGCWGVAGLALLGAVPQVESSGLLFVMALALAAVAGIGGMLLSALADISEGIVSLRVDLACRAKSEQDRPE
ncbi:MAG: hypothetical protein CMJ48_12105 [Planctomycetaceae bacterium]|nr:hypothetical protein [Planctomycetaceae bacterium]